MKNNNRILNDDIRANKVQLITDDWENLWVMSLNEAKAKALENGLDLMLMSKKDDLAIIKMLDYWKFLYREKKKTQKSKAIWKKPDLKTIRITFKIGEHDLEIKRKQAEKFAKANHPLKVSLMLRGRENHYASLAQEKIESFVESLKDIYKLEWPIRRHWNNFVAMLKIAK